MLEIDDPTNGSQAIIDGTTYRQHLWVNSAGAMYVYGGANVNSLDTGDDGSISMWAAVFDSQGASSFARRDGTKGTTGDAHNTNEGRFDKMRVGANNSGSFGFTGYISAIYVTKRTLTDAELDEAQTYCQSKWGTP